MKKTNNHHHHHHHSIDQPSFVWLKHFSAGIFAGAVSRTCTAPLDRLRTFFQGKFFSNDRHCCVFFSLSLFVIVYGLDSNGRMTIRTTLSSMITEGGVQSLWRGNLMNVLKVSPETGVRLMFYETFKRSLGQTIDHEITVFQKFLCGSTAGFTASALIYPLKTIKVQSELVRRLIKRSSRLDSIDNTKDK